MDEAVQELRSCVHCLLLLFCQLVSCDAQSRGAWARVDIVGERVWEWEGEWRSLEALRSATFSRPPLPFPPAPQARRAARSLLRAAARVRTIGRVHVQDCVQRVVKVGHLRGQACKVELVLDVLLIHLREELVAADGAKPGDPGQLAGARLLLRLAHLLTL